MDYHSRLTEVNKDNDKREVLDSIDRPIRPLVIEMHRIGLRTKFSCCGFHYDGEEEPKTHARQKSYVHVFDPNINDLAIVRSFFNMSIMAAKCGWTVFRFHDIWDVGFKVGRGMNNFYDNTKDEIPETIHDYEPNVIAIYSLTESLKQLPTVCEQFFIVDGNHKYAALSEWQVKPKESTMLKIDGDTVKITKTRTIKAMTL